MASDLHFEVTYPHPPDKVWRALTEAELIAAWLVPNDFAPRVGHFFTLKLRPQPGFDGVVHGEVTECLKPQRLGYKWTAAGLTTRVQWALEPVAGRATLVTLDHMGFSGIKGTLARPVLERSWSQRILPGRLKGVLDALDARGRLPEGIALPALD